MCHLSERRLLEMSSSRSASTNLEVSKCAVLYCLLLQSLTVCSGQTLHICRHGGRREVDVYVCTVGYERTSSTCVISLFVSPIGVLFVEAWYPPAASPD